MSFISIITDSITRTTNKYSKWFSYPRLISKLITYTPLLISIIIMFIITATSISFHYSLPNHHGQTHLKALTRSADQVWVALMVLMVASMAFGALYDHLALRWSLPNAMNYHEKAEGSRTFYFRLEWIVKVLLLECECLAGLCWLCMRIFPRFVMDIPWSFFFSPWFLLWLEMWMQHVLEGRSHVLAILI